MEARLLSQEIVNIIMEKADHYARNLANATEGNFKEEEMEAIQEEAFQEILKEQDKVSFKAGQQEGREEVVEWVRNYIGGCLAGLRNEWKDQLKEWEIETTQEVHGDIRGVCGEAPERQ